MSSALPPAPEFGVALPIVASPQVLRFLALRRSASAMSLAEPGPDGDQLGDLLRIAARVPDHGKLSPWRFIVMDGADKAAFADRLESLTRERDEPLLAAKLTKLKAPPMAIVVVSTPRPGSIPEWEQLLSAGAVCATLVSAALAMGFGANWITDWYSYDAGATAILGLQADERIAGFVMLGTAREPPQERERPKLDPLVTHWRP